MIIEQYNSKSNVAGQRLRFKTLHYGKPYYWLTDIDGTWYMLPEGPDGKPAFA